MYWGVWWLGYHVLGSVMIRMLCLCLHAGECDKDVVSVLTCWRMWWKCLCWQSWEHDKDALMSVLSCWVHKDVMPVHNKDVANQCGISASIYLWAWDRPCNSTSIPHLLHFQSKRFWMWSRTPQRTAPSFARTLCLHECPLLSRRDLLNLWKIPLEKQVSCSAVSHWTGHMCVCVYMYMCVCL